MKFCNKNIAILLAIAITIVSVFISSKISMIVIDKFDIQINLYTLPFISLFTISMVAILATRIEHIVEIVYKRLQRNVKKCQK